LVTRQEGKLPMPQILASEVKAIVNNEFLSICPL
jgi:hypothetical protein